MKIDHRTRIITWRQDGRDRGQAFGGAEAAERAVARLAANPECSDVTVEIIERKAVS